MQRSISAVLLSFLVTAEAHTAESVAIRTASGRFVSVREGDIKPGPAWPGDAERFALIAEDKRVALRCFNGCWLVPARGGRAALSARPDETSPPEGALLEIVPSEDGGTTLRATCEGPPLVFDPRGKRSNPEQPGTAETIDIYRVQDVPEALRGAIELAISTFVLDELDGKEYDKTRTRKKQKYVELPAPTLDDLGRTKRRRLYSVTQQYHLKATLDGRPSIRIERLVVLSNRGHSGGGVILFVVAGDMNVRGDVRYKIPDRLSASTGYRTKVRLNFVGEVRTDPSGAGLAFQPPEVRDLRVELRNLDLSNDALHLFHDEIEDLINDELRDRDARIRQEANDAIREALGDSSLRLPMLRFLGL
jgi:hypothetical protein